jgi:membrane fusion protein, multidrug efflux system
MYLTASKQFIMSTRSLTKHRSFLLFSLLSLLAVVILAGCTAAANEKNEAPKAVVPQGVPVDGYIVKTEVSTEDMEVAGTLAANQEVAIVSELPRKIVRVQVKEGNVVHAGDLLFQLDDADLVAQLEQLQQREKLASLNEARLKDLIEHDAAIQQDYDQASTNLKVLQAEVRQLQVTISKTRIRAPFDGRIGIIHAYTGALVSPNTVLTNIVEDAQIKVEFSVPEKYANTILNGSIQPFTVESDSKAYTARVIARESLLDQNTRTLLIRAITPNPGRILLPGQSARIKLGIHANNEALMVVSHALIASSQGYSVYKFSNNQATLTPVETGQRTAYNIQVTKGLIPGDTVITSNLLRLVPGAPVQLVTIK